MKTLIQYTKIIIKNTDVIKINNKEYNTIKVHAKIYIHTIYILLTHVRITNT